MKIKIEVDGNTLRRLVVDYIGRKLGRTDLQETEVKILVQSKQNYRQNTWEDGMFMAIYEAQED